MKIIKRSTAILILCLLVVYLTGYSQTGPIEKCLIVSDIHFNPLYGAKNDTAFRRQLEKSSPAEWQKYFEMFKPAMTLDPSLLGQDANYAVLKSALINMKRTIQQPAFIVIAGDFIWHNATPADSLLKRKSIQFIAWLFKSSFSGTAIIPTMGNNDTYGDDYVLQDPRFLTDFANAWTPNFPKYAADELKAHGYYIYKHANLKLMVINSAPLNFGSLYPAQADTLLNWVQTNLTAAVNKNLWIVSHIPPGLNGYNVKNMWNADYTTRFVNSVVQNASKVKFSIASHTHFNDFKVFYNSDEKPAPVAFMRIVPSICDNHGNNPSFEVAEFNSVTGTVIAEVNHYLNLAAIPVGNNNLNITYANTLMTTDLLSGKINAANFSGLIDKVKTDKTGATLTKYISFYTVGTKIDTTYTINRGNYMNYLQADSLKAK